MKSKFGFLSETSESKDTSYKTETLRDKIS